jgi:hypothetical protein
MIVFGMKNILGLIVISLFVGCENNLFIEHPITEEKIEIAKNDFPESRDFSDANKSCQLLENGWRLPTKEELLEMYKRREEIGGFKSRIYLSSTPAGSHSYYGVDFKKRELVILEYFETGYFRAVRNKN